MFFYFYILTPKVEYYSKATLFVVVIFKTIDLVFLACLLHFIQNHSSWCFEIVNTIKTYNYYELVKEQ